jgi:hypothetical protein
MHTISRMCLLSLTPPGLDSVRGRTKTFCQPTGRTSDCLIGKHIKFRYKWAEKAAGSILTASVKSLRPPDACRGTIYNMHRVKSLLTGGTDQFTRNSERCLKLHAAGHSGSGGIRFERRMYEPDHFAPGGSMIIRSMLPLMMRPVGVTCHV